MYVFVSAADAFKYPVFLYSNIGPTIIVNLCGKKQAIYVGFSCFSRVLFTVYKPKWCVLPLVHLAEQNTWPPRPSWWPRCRPSERRCGWAAGSWPPPPERRWRPSDARDGRWRARSRLSEAGREETVHLRFDIALCMGGNIETQIGKQKQQWMFTTYVLHFLEVNFGKNKIRVWNKF